MQKIMLYNFHTHSGFDDGKGELEKYIEEAIGRGLGALGFSAHAPLGEGGDWCIPKNELQAYCRKVKQLKEQYKNKIDIYLGLEADYIPNVTENFSALKKDNDLEYLIGSIHLVKNPKTGSLWFIDGPEAGYKKGLDKVFDNDAKSAVEAFYAQSCQMIQEEKPDIIGHLDKIKMHNKERYFSEHEKWYQDSVNTLLKVIADSNTIVEVNTRGKYTGKTDVFFPSKGILEKCYMYNIPVMVNTDAHAPEQVNELFDEAIAMLRDIGYRETKTPFFTAKMKSSKILF